jgi:hypothetical protein
MHIIAHRRNTLADLAAVPPRYGVEVDIRSHGDRLTIQHDPYVTGGDFADWIGAYAAARRTGTLILNVKEDGLEARLLELVGRHGIENFFFLDQALPTLVRMARQGEKRCAVRVSEYESVETALRFAGLLDWVWVDCFTRFPLAPVESARLVDAGFRLCLVSPELQGRTDPGEIAALRALIAREGHRVAAVCTKRPDLWEA